MVGPHRIAPGARLLLVPSDFDPDDTFPPGQPHALVLNNSLQDATVLRTCLAYETFAAVGVRAPRCGFAHVAVNEEDLGVYVNVEPIDDAFLAHRDLPLACGLYEGTLSDFRDGWSDTFSAENDAATPHAPHAARSSGPTGSSRLLSPHTPHRAV